MLSQIGSECQTGSERLSGDLIVFLFVCSSSRGAESGRAHRNVEPAVVVVVMEQRPIDVASAPSECAQNDASLHL
ncbi:hypothetical protein LDENG_00265260 [Lucifuga dentata]|nr:hypothetical protein LDENG_00265260 [Lucifuga dentata]